MRIQTSVMAVKSGRRDGMRRMLHRLYGLSNYEKCVLIKLHNLISVDL